MRATIILIRNSDKTEKIVSFKSKKQMQRFLSNNYIMYSWKNME